MRRRPRGGKAFRARGPAAEAAGAEGNRIPKGDLDAEPQRRGDRVHAVQERRTAVEHDEPFPYQVDGDYLGETRELVFRWEPHILDLVLGPDTSIIMK